MSKTLKNNTIVNAEDQGLSSKYQQKTDKQHILDNPDTYIGSVEKVESNLWVLNRKENETTDKIVEKI
jgi:DNA topoisomerase-2